MDASHINRFASETIAFTLAAGLCLGANVCYANPLDNLNSSDELALEEKSTETEPSTTAEYLKQPSTDTPQTKDEISKAESGETAENPVQESSVKTDLKSEDTEAQAESVKTDQGFPSPLKTDTNTIITNEDQPPQEISPVASALELSEEVKPEALKSPQTDVIEISSFDDFKPYLEVQEHRNIFETRPYLTLKPGSYRLTKDINIDGSNSYFTDKSEATKYGLFSVVNGNLNFDGGGKTITFGADKAVPLFGWLKGDVINISNLKLHYLGDVAGFPFAQEISAGYTESEKGFAKAAGLISNVKVKVDGNVDSLKAIERSAISSNYAGNFHGVLATGFSWYLSNVNLENLDISIGGNVGSDAVSHEQDTSAASYGLTWHYSNVSYHNSPQVTLSRTWDELHNKRNPEVLYDAGHVTNLNIYVGGNIQAITNDAGYSAGIGHDMGEAWIDNAHINIKGDIKTIMNGTSPLKRSISGTHAHGISEEVMNFTNSSLNVNRIIYESNPGLYPQKDNVRTIDFARISALADDNSKGNYLNIKNNKIQVKNGIKVKSSLNINACASFINNWNSNSKNGVNWLHYNENNKYYIDSIDIQGTGNSRISFSGYGQKWRTGTEPVGNQDPLPEAALKQNELKVGKVNVSNPNGDTFIFLMMQNMSNAKNNSAEYDDITIKSNSLRFSGMGDLLNQEPAQNVHAVLADGNKLKTGNIKIDTNIAEIISLMIGNQNKEQPMKNCQAIIKSLDVKINTNNPQQSFISGICGYSQSDIDNCALYLGDIRVDSKSDQSLYFGLGFGYAKGARHSNNRVFVDKNIEISHGDTIWGGGYAGYGNDVAIENTHLQIDGLTKVYANGGEYGGFAGRLKDANVSKSSALLLNDYLPFVYGADGGTFDGIAHYINKPVYKYFSGILARHANNKTIIKNSTLLVEKANESSVMYRAQNVDLNQSVNNYVTVVDDSKDGFNRKAYKAELVYIDEGKGKIPVFAKSDSLVGQINIAKRDFQDKYWNENIGVYETGNDEAEFNYVDNQKIGGSKLSFFNLPQGIIGADVSRASLANYYDRHAGVFVEGGPVYDLLGIKATAPDPKPEPTPVPVPTTSTPKDDEPEKTGFYNPIVKEAETPQDVRSISQEALPKTGDSELSSISTSFISIIFLGLTSIAASILLRKKN